MVYDLTETWPNREIWGMTSQVRRAVLSIPCNIGEGKGRTGSRDFAHHLSIASGSLDEVEIIVKAGHRRRYSPDEAIQPVLNQATEVRRLLNGLIRSLRT